MNSNVQLHAVARTHVGRIREANEDAFLCLDPCFLVADGMGGYDAGEIASAVALDAFDQAFSEPGPVTIELVEEAISRARANVEHVAAEAERGAGCTLSGVVLVTHERETYWYLMNIGDSRVYLHHDAGLVQLTADHSLYEELRRNGHPDAELAPRHVITRALGSQDSRHDAWLLPVQENTRLLICTDGLTGELTDAVLQTALGSEESLDKVADSLVESALAAGGRDNITVVLVEVVAGGSPVSQHSQGSDQEEPVSTAPIPVH